jgi:hypothetical protein
LIFYLSKAHSSALVLKFDLWKLVSEMGVHI